VQRKGVCGYKKKEYYLISLKEEGKREREDLLTRFEKTAANRKIWPVEIKRGGRLNNCGGNASSKGKGATDLISGNATIRGCSTKSGKRKSPYAR